MGRLNIKVKISPSILKAIRESSGYSIDEVANKLKSTPERIKNIEEGEASFTITQVKKLADVYHRPLAAFFGDIAPKPLFKLTDYRINRDKKITPQVYLAERRASYLSSKLAELSDKKSQIPTFSETLSPADMASEFRKHLNAKLVKKESPAKILGYYKRLLEDNLLISVIEYPFKADDVRAFCIPSDIAIIVLNESDDTRIKLFSLFHEMCHLLKRTSGLCSMELDANWENMRIESDCNSFAAEFLVPHTDLKLEADKLSVKDWDSISALSDIYGVSKQVIMIRLLRLEHIKQNEYEDLKKNWSAEHLKKKGFRKRNWEKVYLNRVGNLAARRVSNAYKKGDISYSEVIDILNVKTKYIEKIVG
jgi:Zn-dependent peptidase ImmA (M78 family)